MLSVSELLFDIDFEIMKNFLNNPKNRSKFDYNFIEEKNRKKIFQDAFKSQFVK